MKIKTLVAVLLVVFAAACEQNVTSADRTEAISMLGTVKDVDHENRRMRVIADGKTSTLRVSDAVVNFDQIEAGDRIELDFVKSIAVSMADQTDTGEPLAASIDAVAPEGAKPGVASADLLTVVVEFVSYDPATHIAAIKSADEAVHEVVVQPEIRAFAKSRTPGDRIVVSYFLGMAISVREPI